MSTLSSSSTDAEVKAAYDDNASYAEDESTAKAAIFITACRMLLRRMPKQASHGGVGGREIQQDMQLIADEMRAAQRWSAARGPAGQVKRLSLENFRQ